MKSIKLTADIPLLGVKAASFPDGIGAAFDQLKVLTGNHNRELFGMSQPENGSIVYYACAKEQTPGEAEQLKCEKLSVKAGNYIAVNVHNFSSDPMAVQKAFDQLLAHPGIDPEGYCVERYLNENEVECMIRLADGASA